MDFQNHLVVFSYVCSMCLITKFNSLLNNLINDIFYFQVYDVSNHQTFERLSHWMNEVDTYSTKLDAVKMLIGNKIDIVSYVVVQ